MFWRDEDTAQLLIDNGARVNAADHLGNTPLHWAANQDIVPLTGMLLKNGADPDLVAADGTTAMYWSYRRNNVEMAELLMRYDAEINATELARVSHRSVQNVVQFLTRISLEQPDQ